MKNIIVVGYPKSGSTWITRLTAELVGCPVKGFWNEPNHKEIAIEGLERSSNYRCFKAHQTFRDLEIDDQIINNQSFIIYVIRDPRDVAISGANYFRFQNYELSKKINFINRLILKLPYGNTISERFIIEPFKIDCMINAIINGSSSVHPWCSVPWKEHYSSYLKQDCIFIRYEDMLMDPFNESKRILKYLDVIRNEQEIDAAIQRQSFKNRKKEFKEKGDNYRAKFLRRGQPYQWKKKLNYKQKNIFRTSLYEELKMFKYLI